MFSRLCDMIQQYTNADSSDNTDHVMITTPEVSDGGHHVVCWSRVYSIRRYGHLSM